MEAPGFLAVKWGMRLRQNGIESGDLPTVMVGSSVAGGAVIRLGSN